MCCVGKLTLAKMAEVGLEGIDDRADRCTRTWKPRCLRVTDVSFVSLSICLSVSMSMSMSISTGEEGVPQAGVAAPPGQEPGQRGVRGQVQGPYGSLRGATYTDQRNTGFVCLLLLSSWRLAERPPMRLVLYQVVSSACYPLAPPPPLARLRFFLRRLW